MKWKDVAYSRTLHTFVILVISIIAGTWLAPHYEFSQETLPWLTSTIVQAFGAMIAIFLTVGLYQLKTTYESIDKIIELDKRLLELNPASLIKPRVDGPKIIKNLDLQRKTIFSRINNAIQCIAVLIALSLVTLMFINTNKVGNNRLMAILSIFLVMYSLYCIQLLINSIFKTFREY